MLFSTPEVDGKEEAVILRIDEVRKNLSYAIAARRWTGVLRRMTFARGIQGSNSIEGYRATIEDAMAVADNEEPLEAQHETALALRGYRSAMTYILQLADDPHFTHSSALVRSLHFMMLEYDLTRHPGRWRPGPIFVRNDDTGDRVYAGPDAELVNDLVQELIESLNHPPAGVHCLVVAAMAHLNLVMIRPFSDGNGRMGRALQTLVLARGGILAPVFASIEEYLGHNQQAYYDVLAQVGGGAWHPERDARPWVRFCLTAHFRQATTLVRRAKTLQNLWDNLERETERRGLPDRTLSVLSEAALGLKVRNATYRSQVEISENLASRDLKALADAGLLVGHGERRGRVYVASEALRAVGMAAAAGESGKVPDPFDQLR